MGIFWSCFETESQNCQPLTFVADTAPGRLTMGKTLLAIFAVVVCAVSALTALRNDNDELVNVITLVAKNEKQQKCFSDAVKKVWEDNPDLDRWFREVIKLHEKYIQGREACRKLPKKYVP